MSSRNAAFRERGLGGALWAPLAWVLYGLLVFLGLLLAAWCVDGVFVFHVWPEGGEHLRAILVADLARTSAVAGEPIVRPLAIGLANMLYAILFEATGIHDMATRFSEPAALSIPDTIARSSYIAHRDMIEVAMLGTQLFGLRVGMMIAAAPLCILVYVVSAADGLMARAVRCAQGGIESSSLYHRFKYLQLLGFAAVLSICLLVPASFDPRLVWWIAGIPLAAAVRFQWTYYKKYL